MKKLLKMIFLISLINSLSLNNITYAQEATFLNKDDKSPYSGYLLPESTIKELRNNTLERDSYKTRLDLTQKNNDILNQEKTILLDQNLKLMVAGSADHVLNNWEKAGYFLAGIITVGLAIKGAQNLKP